MNISIDVCYIYNNNNMYLLKSHIYIHIEYNTNGHLNKLTL